MKRLLKIIGIIGLILVSLIVILWLVVREKPDWDDQTGHITEQVVLEQDKYTVVKNIKWAEPDGFSLTMDIYTPNNSLENYPVIVMFHGGGWLINSNKIMKDASAYLASTGKYVVCNVNYRLLRDKGNSVKMNEIVEDAFGSIFWVKANVAKYGGDPDRIILTGDSAGGHLAAIGTMQLSDLSVSGYDNGPSGFRPSWIPPGESIESLGQIADGLVKAAVISYGAFDIYEAGLGGFESQKNIFWAVASSRPRGIFGENINAITHSEYYKKVSPFHNYPDTSESKLPPMLFTVGTEDPVVTPTSVKAFMDKLVKKGHQGMEYWEYEGQSHAFLDSGDNFEMNAIPALEKMVSFLDEVFYTE